MDNIDTLQQCQKQAKATMDKIYTSLQIELSKIRAGKASVNLLDGIKVEYYGNLTPIQQISAINTPDARSVVIKPWEKKLVAAIETAIINSNLGLTPQNDGELIRINIPPLTEERRKYLVKQIRQEIEKGRINIRTARKNTKEFLRKLQKEGTSEDAIKMEEEILQKHTNTYITKMDELLATKEAEVMLL